MLTPGLTQIMERAGVAAVLTIADPEDAVPAARALQAGGVSVIELTFRTACAAESIRRIRGEEPGVCVGAGTLLDGAQVGEAKRAGALFGVSPGCNPETIRAARGEGLPFAPGVMTPTDIEFAIANGCRALKFFPAESSGGLAHLRAMAAPFARLGLRFIPLGGIGRDELRRYIESPLVLCVGGSWLARPQDVSRRDWESIRREAAAATRIVSDARASAGS